MSATLRVLKRLGESNFWKKFGSFHTRVYRWTGGRLGHNAGGVTNLLLTTTGRKSGQPRTVPLAYMPDGETYVVVASNGGSDRHPIWWLNLQKKASATVQVGKSVVEVEAVEATDAERERLWPRLKEVNPFYSKYEQITDRHIPVVVLRPAKA